MASKGARYTLEVLLKLRDSLSKGVGKPIAQLDKLEKQAKKTRKAIDALHKKGGANAPARTAAEGYRDATRAVRLEREHTRLATDRLRLRREEARLLKDESRELERRGRASRPPAPTQRTPPEPRRSVPRPGAWRKDSDRPPRWRDEVDPPTQTPPRRPREQPRGALHAVERAGRHVGRARDVAYDFSDAYQQARAGIERYTDPAGELMRARMRLGTLGLSPDEASRADEAIKKTVAAVPGARLSEVTQAFAELYEVFASVDDTARNIQRAAQYSFAMKTIHGDMYSPEQLTTQTKAAYKFVDLIGLTKPDAQGRVDNRKVDEYHDRLMQVLSATGGEVNPREMLQAAKIGGTALTGMSREGLTHIAALASDVTGSRAGNMQRSMLQSFVGGKLFEKHVNALAEFGMVDSGKVRKGKGGKVDLQPGAIRYADTISTDPLIFIDRLAEGMRKRGVDTSSEREVINAAARLTPNTLAQNMIAQGIIRREEMTRFDDLVKKAEALRQMFERAERSPLGKIEDAKAKAENVRATVGTPMVEAGGTLSDYLSRFYTGLQSFAEGSPVMSSALAGIGSLGGAALSAGEGVGTLAGLLRDLRGGGSGGAGSGGGGAGGGGILGTGVGVGEAVQTGGSLAWGAAKLAGRVAGPVGVAAASAFTGKQLYRLYTVQKELREARARAAAANAGNLDTVGKTREEFGRMGQPVPREVWQAQAGGALAKLNTDNQLRAALSGWTAGSAAYQGFRLGNFTGVGQLMGDAEPYAFGPRRFSTGGAAATIRERAPELKAPEIMGEFRRLLDTWKLPNDQRGQLDKALQAAFPESFAKSATEAAGGLTKVTQPAEKTAAALLNIYNPADNLGRGLGQAQSAAYSFAARLNALDIRTSFNFPFQSPPSNMTGGISTPGANGGGRKGVPGSPLNGLFTAPTRATGGIVRRGGFVEVHDQEAIVPAKVTDRWRDEEFAAAPDFSLFGSSAAAGGGVHNYNLSISVPPGSRAADDPEAFARLVMQKIDELQRENATLRAEVVRRTDPRRIERHIKHRMETEEERA